MMAARYLNRDDKTAAVTIGGVAAYLEQRAEKERQLGRKERAKYLKMATAWASKALQDYVQPLADEQARLVIREAQRSIVGVYTPSEAAARRRQVDTTMTVLVEDLYDLAVAVQEEACYKCTKTGRERAECPARRVMLALDIPVYDDKAPEGECPYRCPGEWKEAVNQ